MSDNKHSENTPEITAGQMLMNARTANRRKRELATIARQLCIKEEFLAALEAGEYNKIPEVVYILGFARNYAVELGLDPDEIVRKIKSELKLPAKEEDIWAEMAKEAPAKKVSSDMIANPLKKSIEFVHRNWKWISISLGAVVVIVVVLSLILGGSSSDEVITDNTIIEAPAFPAPEFTQPVRETFGSENKDSGIALQAIAETWLKIESAKGETLFSRVLVAGDIYYAPVGAKATLGNAGGVDVWVNGKMIPKLGAANTRKSGIVLTPESLASVPAAN